MDLVIRHVTERDLEAVHEILTSPHVVAGSLRVPFAPLRQTRERLTPARGIYQLVAEAEGRVVGFGELITFPDDPRERHVGDVNAAGLRRRRLDGRASDGPAARPLNRPRPPGRILGDGRYTRLDRRVEAPMTLVINLAYLAGIVLVPVGIAALFIRLSRRFLSS